MKFLNKSLSIILLLVTSFFWGTTFLFQKIASNYFDAYSFITFRCLISFILIFIFLLLRRWIKKKKGIQTRINIKNTLLYSIPVGIVLFFGMTLQQVGVKMTSVAKGGFLSSLYIVLVPILGVIFKKFCKLNEILAVLLAIAGTYFLSFTTDFKIGRGELLIIIGSGCYALHILFVDKASKNVDPIIVSCIQFLICSVLGLITSIIFGDLRSSISNIDKGYISILYAGVLSGCVGYSFQIISQRHIKPVLASLILSLESVFSCLAGVVILKEILNGKEIIGCCLIFAAIILGNITFKKRDPDKPRVKFITLLKLFIKGIIKKM